MAICSFDDSKGHRCQTKYSSPSKHIEFEFNEHQSLYSVCFLRMVNSNMATKKLAQFKCQLPSSYFVGLTISELIIVFSSLITVAFFIKRPLLSLLH